MAEPASNNVFDELAGAKASGNKEYSDYLQSAIDYSDKTYGGDFTKTAMGGEPSAAQAPTEEMPYAEDLFSSVRQTNPEQPLHGVSPYPAKAQEVDSGELPYAEDLFGPAEPTNWLEQAHVATQRSIIRIQNAFGIQARAGFGEEPVATPSTALSPETLQVMKDRGMANDYAKGQASFDKAVYEAIARSASAALLLGERTLSAAAGGVLGAGVQALEELGLPQRGKGAADIQSILTDPGLQSILTDPGVMVFTGGLGGVGGELEAIANARRLENLRGAASKWRAAGVTAEGEAGFYDAVPLTPENAQARVDAANEAGVPVPTPRPPPADVHELARRIEPDAFRQFDSLEAEKQQATQRLEALRSEQEAHPDVVEAQDEIRALLGQRPRETPTAPEPPAAPLSDNDMENIFLRPQPEEQVQPTLPSVEPRRLESLPVVGNELRLTSDAAALRAQDEALAQQIRGLPRGGRPAADTLARLDVVEQRLADEGLSAEQRKTFTRRRDELLTNTTPEKLKAEAAPIAQRRALHSQRARIAERLAEIEQQRANVGVVPGLKDTAEALARVHEEALDRRVAEAHARIEAVLGKETPEIAEARQALEAATQKQNALLPDVASAYAQAREMLPETPATVKAEELVEATKPVGEAEAVAPKAPELAPDAGAVQTPGDVPRVSLRVSTGGLRSVKGTGELKTRTLAQGVEDSAIEGKLTESFGDLPEYHELSMADQAAKASELIKADYENAKAIALGRLQPPRDVLPESVFVALEKHALATGDVETLRQLATESKLTTAATTMGQRIRTLGERDPASPVGALQEIARSREAAVERGLKGKEELIRAKAAAVSEIKTEIRKAASTRSDWNAYIDALRCKE